MTRAVLVVESEPSNPADEDEYNRWYQLKAQAGDGRLEISDALGRDPRPVVRLYELIE